LEVDILFLFLGRFERYKFIHKLTYVYYICGLQEYKDFGEKRDILVARVGSGSGGRKVAGIYMRRSHTKTPRNTKKDTKKDN